jgi:hypothetical protein
MFRKYSDQLCIYMLNSSLHNSCTILEMSNCLIDKSAHRLQLCTPFLFFLWLLIVLIFYHNIVAHFQKYETQSSKKNGGLYTYFLFCMAFTHVALFTTSYYTFYKNVHLPHR